MATKRRRGGTWSYVIKRQPLPRPVYLSFKDEHEGDEYVARLEALLDRGIVPEEFTGPAAASLRSAVAEYRSARPISADDKKLLPVVLSRLPSDMKLRQVSFTWATEWITAMKREHNMAPSTIRHHVGALSRALDWITAKGMITANPLRMLPVGYSAYTDEDARVVSAVEGMKPKADEERDRRLRPGEEDSIRSILAGAKPVGRERAFTLNERLALALLFDMALETAMRMREMYTLTWDQIDLTWDPTTKSGRTIFLDRTKNGDRRQVPISSVLLALLKDYKGNFDGRLFPWWDGRLDKDAMDKITTKLSRQYDRIFNAAGAEDLRFHDLRHEATSRLYERTKLSDVQISTITGHRNPRMLKRYANLRASTLAESLW